MTAPDATVGPLDLPPVPGQDAPRPEPLDLPRDSALDRRPPSGVGLCLSGGGFRAMLFHLGSLWRLNDAGLLPTLTTVSSVSGGSIAAGALAAAWSRLDFGPDAVGRAFRTEVADPLLALAARTIDVPAVLLGFVTGGAAKRVAASYDRHLFHGATLQDLPAPGHGPDFVILATNQSNARLFRFSRDSMRDWSIPDTRNPTLPLAQAVAASSAFPPFLSPLAVPLSKGRRAYLTDGGVYDNMGIEPVLKSCATLYVSDGGGPFAEQERPPTDWLFGTLRTLTLIHTQVGRLRRRQVMAALASGQRTGAFWAIDTVPTQFPRPAGTLPTTPERTRALAILPTRLAPPSAAERHQLVNWGYAAADAALRSYAEPHLPEPAGFPLSGGVGAEPETDR